MKYTKNAYIKADETIKKRREKAEEQRKLRYEEINAAAPEIIDMYNSLKFGNCELIKSLGSRANINKSDILKIKSQNMDLRNTIGELLSTCGYPSDYLQYHFYCKKCKDTGYNNGKMCDCLENLLIKYSIEEINNSCSIKLHDFSDFSLNLYPKNEDRVSPRDKMEIIYNICIEYTNSFSKDSPSLFFIGKTGLGKTLLSSCIAKNLLEKGYNVIFCSIPSIFRQVEDEHFGRKEGNTFNVINSCDLLILDDLGSEFQTGFTDSVLYEILNNRLNLYLPTIITTNLTTKDLDNKYNDRIISRLTGCFTPLMFLGNDVRQEIRRNKSNY